MKRNPEKIKLTGILSVTALSLLFFVSTISKKNNITQEQPEKWNFVFILIDDLGWKDVGAFGSTFYQTPHIDKLVREGMKFTNAYAACTVCSPTRASIMTGKYPARLHITDWIPGHQAVRGPSTTEKFLVPSFRQELPLAETTIAEALHPAGYVSASIGKWHLGGQGFLPTDQGFDVNVAGNDKGQPPSYFYPYERKDGYSLPGLNKTGEKGEYLTDRLTSEAEKFLTENKDKPFFLYLSHYAVHTPLQAKQLLVDQYQAKVNQENPQHNPVYAAMVQSMDESVGRIRAKLKQLQIADKTVIIFTSDNGGLTVNTPPSTSNLPLRAGKGSPYEGGVRVPLVIYWPRHVKPNTLCNEPVMSIDFFPTLLDMAGIHAQDSLRIDGVSLIPLLQNPADSLLRNNLFWHYPHYHPGGATPYNAIRQGPWKLINFLETNEQALYNLQEDLGEQHDLSQSMPQKTLALKKILSNWLKEVEAQMPTPNPNYKSEK